MKEIALENAEENASISDVTVKELVPVSVKLSNASPIMRTGAITITGTITT